MNDIDNEELIELAEPKYNTKVSNLQLLTGSYIPPIDRLKIVSPSEFEEIVEEWLYGYLSKKYEKVIRVAGAGDKGRDVIAFERYSKDGDEIWDNYQCKHYNAPLTPSEMWVEFGKVCYYTYKGDYSIPRKYYFVSPHGVGGKLFDFIMNPNTLKSELIKEWDKNCLKKITKVEEVHLKGNFKKYVEGFDFSIFDVINPAELIAQYQQTIYFPFRFGGGLRKLPDRPSKAPDEIKQEELLYVKKLYDAYANHKNKRIDSISDLKQYKVLMNHFNRQRTYFYQAESLKVFERDSIPEGVNAFEELKDQIYHGIIDTVYSEHKDGFERVKATTERAMNITISSDNIFSDIVNGKDKSGICHHLANDEKYIEEEEIIWVIDDEE
ncbi:restriction endonuclease [Ectobacillus sp. JY-23]|uniref:ABC-three component system protein n=1 Tax=Ectobacillus sp. JY-23 TaxID=2933872 RepID=UPI001FF1FB2E|nr:ABC-three component system protein [Ectobacillus sp. JY-23]UOY94183.1 restriction endonuclease [Ectobacillus sp. JY-23]